MFDSEIIVADVGLQVQRHFRRLGAQLGVRTANDLTIDDTPLAVAIRRLVAIANGAVERSTASDDTVGEVVETLQTVLDVLFAQVSGSAHAIPAEFWSEPGIGQVLAHIQVWLRRDDLIGYSEAATLLFPDLAQENIQAARMRIKRLVTRGALMSYLDPSEANPTHSARVSRQATLALAAAGVDAPDDDASDDAEA